MRICTILTIVVMCVLTVGCGEGAKSANSPEPDKRLVNCELVNSFNDLAMQNALVSQHTLYPYHYVKNSAEFNELGQRDFAILASHFKKYPGQLNVRRDGIAPDIYEARVKRVLEGLKEAGVDVERTAVSDGMPGGSGMSSERIVTILAKSEKTSTRTATTTTVTTGARR